MDELLSFFVVAATQSRCWGQNLWWKASKHVVSHCQHEREDYTPAFLWLIHRHQGLTQPLMSFNFLRFAERWVSLAMTKSRIYTWHYIHSWPNILCKIIIEKKTKVKLMRWWYWWVCWKMLNYRLLWKGDIVQYNINNHEGNNFSTVLHWFHKV